MDAKTPTISVSQMIAAGLASAGAAAATSRFGVAGTLVGAALTTMIITGGSAVIKAYLENIGGRLKNVPQTLRANRNRQQAGRTAEQPAAEAPTEPVETGGERRSQRRGERRGFLAKVRSAFEWFRGLPSSAKRSILLKAAIPMVVAFVVAIVAITGTELLGGRTLSCMVWGECYVASDGSSGSRTSFGALSSGGGGQPLQPVDETQDGQPMSPDGSEEQPMVPGGADEQPMIPDGSEEQPADPAPVAPEQPADPAPVAPEQPADPAPVAPEQPAPDAGQQGVAPEQPGFSG